MPRFRRSFRRRAPKSRTRWMSLVPHALTFSGNDTTDLQVMEIHDSRATVPWEDFVGGTILRTIVDIVLSPTYPSSWTAPFTAEHYFHVGIFTSPEILPDIIRWDPNVPHAEFMYREMAVETWYGRTVTGQAMQSKHSSSHGQRMHFDSTIKRRLRENDQLWMSGHMFELTSSGGALGYTGRVLIQLP